MASILAPAPSPGSSTEGNGDQGDVKQTEEHVLSQTHDVFVSFLRERVRNDEEKDQTRIFPSTPTGTYSWIKKLVKAEDWTTAEVGRRLANIGDDITKQYEDMKFEDMKRQLADNEIWCTYESLQQIANRIFGDKEVNWGRIIALFYFAYLLFKDVIWQFANDCTKVVTDIAANIAQYFKVLGIAQWIAGQGGWKEILGATAISILGATAIFGVTAIVGTTIRSRLHHIFVWIYTGGVGALFGTIFLRKPVSHLVNKSARHLGQNGMVRRSAMNGGRAVVIFMRTGANALLRFVRR